MAKIEVEILSPALCEQRSLGTDAITAGWWYHGTTEKRAKEILSGKKKIYSPFPLTQNPAGYSQHHGTTVLRCRVKLHKSQPPQPTDDKYFLKDGDEELDKPYAWLKVVEGHVYIANNSLGCQSTPVEEYSKRPPTVGEELERLTRIANNRAQAKRNPRA